MEEKVIRPLYHKHPLILKENVCKEERVDCYGCGNPVANLEMAYVCMELHCSYRNRSIILHKKCGELPNQIRHPKHPNHPIHLFDFHQSKWHMCSVCSRDLDNVLGYRCSSCEFDVDITCEKIGIDALLEERKELQHPSHPGHPLTLMRKPAFAFYCDGCGAQDVDMAYICSTCEFMIHKRCAALPLRRLCHHHHHHLTLAFSFPKRHLKYNYRCEVCDKLLDRTCWVYYCGDCRYFVHIGCVESSTKPESNGDEDVTKFPLYANDISNKLLTPFVMREKGGVDNIPIEGTTTTSFLFKYHEHPLSLVSEEATDDELKICNACITPISSPPYYKCPNYTCKYFIHSICTSLPNTLHSSTNPNPQLYGDCQDVPNKSHNFTLYGVSKSNGRDAISYWYCNLCDLPTNGVGYECASCGMKIDIKCASLPTTIKHASHPQHETLIRIPTQEAGGKRSKCHGCYTRSKIAYHCSSDGCDFALNLECLLMPKSVREEEWDEKHPLVLTFDASLDHPSDFFCEFCEKQMHPKSWMYHCRKCDVSFHLVCLKNASGWYRNVKFGRRFELGGIHRDHPLTFTYITLKRRCDRCRQRVYTDSGFECASCYYVVCQDCGGAELEAGEEPEI